MNPNRLPLRRHKCTVFRGFTYLTSAYYVSSDASTRISECRRALNICVEVFVVAKMNLALCGSKGRPCLVLRVREMTSVKAQLQL